MTTEQAHKDRNQMVCQHNDLIQKTKFPLKEQQEKILLYVISKIKPESEDFEEYRFNLADFCSVCGFATSGKLYKELKKSILSMAGMVAMMQKAPGVEVTVHLIEKVEINKNEGTITVKLDKDLKPYLLQLWGNYTRFELFWILSLKSKYSIRLYELARSIDYDSRNTYSWDISIDRLKDVLGADVYKDWWGFKERALNPAVEEVSKKTDVVVTYATKKEGKAITGITLTVSPQPYEKRIPMMLELEDAMDKAASPPPSADAHSFAGESVVGYASAEAAPSGSEPEEPKRKPKTKAPAKTATKKKAESPSTPLPDTIRTKKK